MSNQQANQNVLDPDLDEANAATEPPHILLVEDDDQMRSMIAQTLRQKGYEVTECPDAFHCMEYCVGQSVNNESIRYSLVISDIRLPGVNGLELLEGLRVSRHRLPVILITAFGDEETHERAAELGAKAVLDKPFAMQDLLKAVHEHCASSANGRPEGSGREDQLPGNGPLA